MRVMCINDKWKKHKAVIHNQHPVFGEVYTVVSTIEIYGISYYELEEMPPDTVFITDHFSPLSNIDERELIVENLQLETA